LAQDVCLLWARFPTEPALFHGGSLKRWMCVSQMANDEDFDWPPDVEAEEGANVAASGEDCEEDVPMAEEDDAVEIEGCTEDITGLAAGLSGDAGQVSQPGVVEETLMDDVEEELVNGVSHAAVQTINDDEDVDEDHEDDDVAEIVEDTVVDDFGSGPPAGLPGLPARNDSDEAGGSAPDGVSDNDVEVLGVVPAPRTPELGVAGPSTPPGVPEEAELVETGDEEDPGDDWFDEAQEDGGEAADDGEVEEAGEEGDEDMPRKDGIPLEDEDDDEGCANDVTGDAYEDEEGEEEEPEAVVDLDGDEDDLVDMEGVVVDDGEDAEDPPELPRTFRQKKRPAEEHARAQKLARVQLASAVDEE